MDPSLNPFSWIPSMATGWMNANAQGETNAQNAQMFQAQMGFNATEAELSRQFASQEAGIGRAWSSAEAAVNRDFQQAMSNTAFQRSRADMEKAGINPILAAGGSGASTPSGSMPSSGIAGSSTASVGSPPTMKSGLQAGLSSALETRSLVKDLENTDSVIALNEAAAKAKEAETEASLSNARMARTRTDLMESQRGAVAKRAEADAADAAFDLDHVSSRNYGKLIGSYTSSAASVGRTLNPWLLGD